MPLAVAGAPTLVTVLVAKCEQANLNAVLVLLMGIPLAYVARLPHNKNLSYLTESLLISSSACPVNQFWLS